MAVILLKRIVSDLSVPHDQHNVSHTLHKNVMEVLLISNKNALVSHLLQVDGEGHKSRA